MSMVVQHNLTAMNANRMLGITTKSQAKSTEKLSSGYRINRAADDAAGLSISEKMRKQIRGLTKASSNAQDGISAVQTAEGALTEVTDMLQRMNELAVQASNSTNSESDRKSIQDEIDQLIEEIDRVSETTKFNETYLLKGDKNGTKITEYSYATQELVANQTVYSVGTDGSVQTVAAGATLDANETYYLNTQTVKVGTQIATADLTSLSANGGTNVTVSVGSVISSTDLISTNYASSATIITTDGYYTLNGTTYVAVDKGAVYDTNFTYYTLETAADGTTIYSAVSGGSISTATGYTLIAGVTVYDETGATVASGAVLDTSKTYYSAMGSATISIYAEKTSVINADNLYTKDASGEYKSVAKGSAYDATATYYTMTTASTGGVQSAIEVTDMPANITDGYKAAITIYDANGNTVNKGDVIDTTATYYSTVTTSTIATGAVTDISSICGGISDDFQFCDKDGNEIAANGLYRYFDENGEYDGSVNGGLYFRDGSAVTDADIEKYITSQDSDVGKLKLSFHVGADATEKNQITIELESMSAKTLGIENVKVSGEDDTNALNAIETISAALSKVSSQRSALGAIQNRLEHTIANLDNIVENTTSAESQIRDTDMATEMVNYSKNNILAQAGQSMLAQANQSNQGVLSLLG